MIILDMREILKNCKKYLISYYRERQSKSDIRLLKILTHINLMIGKLYSDNKGNKDDLYNLREYILLMLSEEKITKVKVSKMILKLID